MPGYCTRKCPEGTPEKSDMNMLTSGTCTQMTRHQVTTCHSHTKIKKKKHSLYKVNFIQYDHLLNATI